MFEIEAMTRQVLDNCDITDAQHAGLYSTCGLALRLRDLYKWEHRLNPWEEKDSSEILDWIGEKEALWEKLAEAKFRANPMIHLTLPESTSPSSRTVFSTGPGMPSV